MRKLLAMALLAPFAATGCATWESGQFSSRHKSKPAADFELTSLDGSRVRLSSFRGKPVVLTFWAYG